MKLKKPTKVAGYDEDSVEPFSVSYIPNKSGTYTITIGKAISCVDQFEYAIQVLEMATENDQVVIRLQSPGGALDAADAFIHAMRGCIAPIHIVATGNVSSAASFILLESSSFELSDGFSALLHCGSLGSGGAYNEYKQQTDFYNKFMPATMRRYYEGFLDEVEIHDMLNGKDIILDAQGWVDRHNKRNEYIAKKMAEFQKAQKKTTRKKKVLDTPLET